MSARFVTYFAYSESIDFMLFNFGHIMIYKNFCTEVANQAGQLMRDYLDGEKNIDYKEGSEVVTMVDNMINEFVIDSVKKTFPTHGVLGEEGDGGVNEGAEYVWITDPIDGTIPYSRGIKISCFSLALLKDGVPIVGCVYQPYNDELYYAEKGQGAMCNDKKINVTDKSLYDKGVILGQTMFLNEPYQLKGLRDELYEKDVTYFDYGTVTYMGCLIASGKMDGLIFPHYKPYDIAAVKVIVEEAGGVETDLFGEQQRFDQKVKGNIVTNSVMHKELLEMVDRNLSI